VTVKVGTIRALAARLEAGNPTLAAGVLAELFDHAPDLAFFVKDSAGRYVAVNASLIKRHGYRHKWQVLGRRPCDICPGDFGRLPAEQDAQVLRTGKPLVDHLERQWYVPRKPVWCLTTKLPLRDAAGKVTGLIGISRDVRAPVDPRNIPAELAAALEGFEKNLAESVTPASLARRAGLTPPRLARLIRRFFDLTPSQFLTRTRLAAGARLLCETSLGVSEIAHQCGFYDHSAFSRAFHSAMGVTPSAYRESRRRESPVIPGRRDGLPPRNRSARRRAAGR
jgi:PAS domain S-box-containing protein